MFDRLVEFESRLSETQKVGVGTAGLLAGIAAIALLVTVPVSSWPAQVMLGLLGVAMLVVGTLSLGTSDGEERVV